MTLVKGSVKKRVKVIEYRIRDLVFWLLLLMLLLCSVLAGSWLYFTHGGEAGAHQAQLDLARLRSDVVFYKTEVTRLEQLLTNTKMAATVDKQANEDVRQEIINLNSEIARLSEENTFYRGLMAPNENASGLTLGAVELVAAGEPRHYAYSVIVKQLATRHSVMSGSLKFTVHGRENGVDKSYSLKDLSSAVSADALKFRFKYFQVLDGQLVLPLGFEPKGIEIEARSSGNSPQQVTKKFGWLIEEK